MSHKHSETCDHKHTTKTHTAHAHTSHSHAGHSHAAPESFTLAFAIAIGLNLLFTLIEAGYAIYAGSMSLLADAGHNLSDVIGLVFAGVASWLLTKAASQRYSYGYKRTTIIAAIINALLLVGASAIIAYESIVKLLNSSVIDEKVVMAVALIGIFVNGGTALLFMRGQKEDLNIKGAYLHLAADAVISIGVVISAVIIMYTHQYWVDPVVGLLIVVTIVIGTWQLLQQSLALLLDAVPHNINYTGVANYLATISGVSEVHDLHIWGLSTRETALTAHLVMPVHSLSDEDYMKISHDLKHDFAIDHVTLQPERGSIEHRCTQQQKC